MNPVDDQVRVALPATISPESFVGLDQHAPMTALGGETMGTRWNVRAVLPPDLSVHTVEAAIVARLDVIVGAMSHWSPSSILSGFNRSPPGAWTLLGEDFTFVMAQGLAIAAASGGAFDPTIGRLVDLYGFGPMPARRPPTDREIAAARGQSGWTRLTFEQEEGRLRQPGGLKLDLSGIAKGFAVDALADLLTELGIAHALVEIGGELVGRGVRPDGQPWWVDLEVPPGLTLPPFRVALHGLAVATSGDYLRGAHTIDPRTGRPCRNGVVSASVIQPSALAADAWATALTVLGAEDGLMLAARHGIAARIVTDIGGAARQHLSPALAAMLSDD